MSNNKQLKLTEGYIGQTVEDFLNVCIEADVIDKFYLSNIEDDDYNPVELDSYGEVIDKYGDCEFVEFDCVGDEITVNIDTFEEYSDGDFYSTLDDFLQDCNDDLINIFDLATEEVVFSGYVDDIPDELRESVFVSFDAPNAISITYEGEPNFDDDEDDYYDDITEEIVEE